jgi:signal transduction histidine kinase
MSEFDQYKKLVQRLGQQGVGKSDLDQIRELIEVGVQGDQEKRHLERELEKFKLMADWSPCTISWIKDDYTYAGVNKTLCELYGVDAQEFIGKKVGFNSDYNYFLEFSKSLFTSEEESLSAEFVATIEKSEKKFYLVGTKFKGQKEAIIIGLDITELSSLKDSVALMKRLSSLGEMVAGIVHEVNNPLTVVQNKAKIATRYIQKGKIDEALSSLETISKTCVRMGKIIEGVKSFAREAEADPHTKVMINETLIEARDLLLSKFLANDVKVLLPTEIGPSIVGNQTQLYQVFINLMTNAIDAIAESDDKWIEVETRALDDKRVEILFRDSGSGISQDLRDKVFQSFFTTKESGKGTGLGLSLSKKIVEKHGGTLEVQDEKNTCFRLILAA